MIPVSEGEGESDWFEQAVGEDTDNADEESVEWEDDWDAADPSSEADPDADETVDPSDSQPEETIEDRTSEAGTQQDTGDTGDFVDDDFAATASDDDTESPFVEFADEPTDEQQPDDQPTDEGQLFEDDFAAALSDTDVPEPVDDGDDGGGDDQPDSDAFGMTGDTVDPTDSAFDMGTDDFGGFSDLGGAGDTDFDVDEDELDSDIDRIDLGVEGLDAMIQGGVPERTLMVAIGSPGTGKTTLGLQFLNEGLRKGDKAVYITLEESRQRVIRSATEKGMPFDEYHDDGQLAVIDIDPIEMANSLQTIRSELPRLIDDFGATRLVLDSVSLLEMMYQDRATRRNEIYDFTKSLKKSGVTTLMTSEAGEDSYTSRHKIVEYLTDAVFVLQYVRPSDFRETRLAIEIQKIRDAHHSRETKPYEITNEGINVYRQANIF